MQAVVKQVHQITKQEMTRKEFLKFTGAAMLGVVGIGSLLYNLQALQQKSAKSGRGYGSSPYGR